MGAAIHSVDVVGKGEDHFVVAVVILHSYFCDRISHFPFQIDHIRMQHFQMLDLVNVADEGFNASLIVKHYRLSIVAGILFPLVGEDNPDTAV